MLLLRRCKFSLKEVTTGAKVKISGEFFTESGLICGVLDRLPKQAATIQNLKFGEIICGLEILLFLCN